MYADFGAISANNFCRSVPTVHDGPRRLDYHWTMQIDQSNPILIADDHPVIRDGLACLISDEPDLFVIAETANGTDAIELFIKFRPAVALLDLKIPQCDGVEATKQIREFDPAAKIIILTSYSGDVQASRAIAAGALGFLLKCSLRTELIAAIRRVLSGHRWIPAAIAREMREYVEADCLTNREIEVLKCIADGASNKQVAAVLRLSEETIKSYVKNLISKLRANDRTHAVTIALRRGYLDL